MTDIDSLFKKPALPSTPASAGGSRKRKVAPSHDPVAAYKAAKLSAADTSPDRTARVDDAPEDAEYEASDAASSLPADFFDAPEAANAEEDEDGGRFFGGGVDKKQVEYLNYIDEAEKEVSAAVEKIDVQWLRKKALSFEKKINKNSEMRGKFEDEPHKFMASEEDLDAEIKSFSILSEHPELFKEFRKLGSLRSLVQLLAHENSDIAMDVVEVISELTDDEVEAEPEQWSELVDGMVEEQVLEMLVQNLGRLNEGNESDRSGVYHTLSVFENLASQQALAEQLIRSTTLLSWLLTRIQVRESPLTQNKQYSAELLAILLQSSPLNRAKLTDDSTTGPDGAPLNGIDIFLQLLAPYRKRDPVRGGDEEEFVENIFDCVTVAVSTPEGKRKFVEAEGVELALIMLREGKMAKARALRLLDHAVTSTTEPVVAIRIVEAAGLKTLFGMFMKKADARTVEHLLGILASMLRLLPADEAPRIRLLAKFVEKDYAKIERLVDIRRDYRVRLGKVEKEIEAQREVMSEEDREEVEEEWLSRRLDAGLYGVQLVDLILAWLCAEDGGAATRIKERVEKEGWGVEGVKATLKEMAELIGDDVDAEQRDTKDMINTLLTFL